MKNGNLSNRLSVAYLRLSAFKKIGIDRRKQELIGIVFLFLSFELLFHQLAFLTPGISPLRAISRKHILHKPKSLIYPLFFPQRKHRLRIRLENLGFFSALIIWALVAMFASLKK